jgi:hypothetical protein
VKPAPRDAAPAPRRDIVDRDASEGAPVADELKDRLEQVQGRIRAACARARRDVNEVSLVAVTKYAGPEQIRAILSLGVADLAENRVQQLQQRAAQINEYHARRTASGETGLPTRLRWHMIGHLQRNKVKQVLPVISMVHSVDSLRLAEELDQQLDRVNQKAGTQRRLHVLLQINASEEPQKQGVAVGAATHLAEQVADMPNLQMAGVMTMAAYGADASQVRHTFSRTREVFEEMKWNKIGGPALKHLSMGMTDDFEIAIEEGSTIVRVGSALFGRPASRDTEGADHPNDHSDD